MISICSRNGLFLLFIAIASPALFTANEQALAGGACPDLPGNYTILDNQPYALCAGAASVNFGEVTYAKCSIKNGSSISVAQTYPFPASGDFTTNSSIPGTTSPGNISTVNEGGSASGGYVVSTFSAPTGTSLYTCQTGSYAQCDGGLCFKSTTGAIGPLWGQVSSQQIICSCPVTTTTKKFQVYGPGKCPATAAEYDAVCGTNTSSKNNGAVLYICAPAGTPDLLNRCLKGNAAQPFPTCARPAH